MVLHNSYTLFSFWFNDPNTFWKEWRGCICTVICGSWNSELNRWWVPLCQNRADGYFPLLLVINGEQLPLQKSETAHASSELILMHFCKQWLNHFILWACSTPPQSIMYHIVSNKNDWLTYPSQLGMPSTCSIILPSYTMLFSSHGDFLLAPSNIVLSHNPLVVDIPKWNIYSIRERFWSSCPFSHITPLVA